MTAACASSPTRTAPWRWAATATLTSDLAPAYELLSRVMDQRLVARMNVPGQRLQWEIPVKRLRRNGGVIGRLRVYEDRIVFAASASGQSRTWRDSDIELVSSDSPFRLLLVTHEKNGRFDFQLRHRLEPPRYEALWLRLESGRGLRLLNEPARPGRP